MSQCSALRIVVKATNGVADQLQ